MAGKASIYWINGVKPSIGDIATAYQIGRGGRGIFTWFACPDCGLERWVAKHAKSKLCMSCAAVRRQLIGEKNPRWKGGVRQGNDGYRYITVTENHPFIEMAGKVFVHGKYRYYIAEHRLVMAQHLNRPLKPWELVHHRNGIRWENQIENLELLKHRKHHLPSMSVQRLEKELNTAKARITMLEADLARIESLLEGGRDSVPQNTEFKAL